MAVATGTSDPVFSIAVVTLVNDSAKFTRSTTSDRTEHFAVTGRNRVAKRRKVCWCVLPQAVRDGGQLLLAPTATLVTAFVLAFAGWPLKDLFDHRTGIDLRDLGQM